MSKHFLGKPSPPEFGKPERAKSRGWEGQFTQHGVTLLAFFTAGITLFYIVLIQFPKGSDLFAIQVYHRAAPKSGKSVSSRDGLGSTARARMKGAPELAYSPQSTPNVDINFPDNIRVSGDIESKSKGINQDQDVPDAPEKIGARGANLYNSEKGTVFRVSIASKARCMEGDMDIIRREIAHNEKAKLLMTVEPLGSSADTTSPLVKHLSLSDLTPGKTFTFTVPDTMLPQNLGLYICLDSSGDNRCSNKVVTNLSNLNPNFRRNETGKNKKKRVRKVRDKVYFFQYFLLEGNNVVAFNNLSQNNGSYWALTGYLKNRLGGLRQASLVVSQVRDFNDPIASLPAKVSRRHIEINLPRYERGQCKKRNIKFPRALLRKLEKKGISLAVK